MKGFPFSRHWTISGPARYRKRQSISIWREAGTALLLGSAYGLIVALIVWFWHWTGMAVIAIVTSILLVIFVACLLGLGIPTLLHSLKLDLKIAAGPIILAMADIFTIIIYLGLATVLL